MPAKAKPIPDFVKRGDKWEINPKAWILAGRGPNAPAAVFTQRQADLILKLAWKNKDAAGVVRAQRQQQRRAAIAEARRANRRRLRRV